MQIKIHRLKRERDQEMETNYGLNGLWWVQMVEVLNVMKNKDEITQIDEGWTYFGAVVSMKKICQGAFTCKTKFKPIIFQFKNFCSSNKRLCFSCCLILFQCANLVRQVSLCETKCFNYIVRHSVYFSLFIYIFQENVLSCSKKLCELINFLYVQLLWRWQVFVEIRRLKFVIHLYTEKSDFRGKTSAPLWICFNVSGLFCCMKREKIWKKDGNECYVRWYDYF